MVDRPILYPGSTPRTEDIMGGFQDGMIGTGRSLSGIFGPDSVSAEGLSCIPGQGLTVVLSEGSVTKPGVVDGTPYGEVQVDKDLHAVANTTSLPQQFLHQTSTVLAFSGEGSFAIIAVLSIEDGNKEILPYYNPEHPEMAYPGPGGSGTAQPTKRNAVLTPSVVPADQVPEGAYILYKVTVPKDAKAITADMIVFASTVPFHPNLKEVGTQTPRPFDAIYASSVGGYKLNALVSDPSGKEGMYYYAKKDGVTVAPAGTKDDPNWGTLNIPDIASGNNVADKFKEIDDRLKVDEEALSTKVSGVDGMEEGDVAGRSLFRKKEGATSFLSKEGEETILASRNVNTVKDFEETICVYEVYPPDTLGTPGNGLYVVNSNRLYVQFVWYTDLTVGPNGYSIIVIEDTYSRQAIQIGANDQTGIFTYSDGGRDIARTYTITVLAAGKPIVRHFMQVYGASFTNPPHQWVACTDMKKLAEYPCNPPDIKNIGFYYWPYKLKEAYGVPFSDQIPIFINMYPDSPIETIEIDDNGLIFPIIKGKEPINAAYETRFGITITNYECFGQWGADDDIGAIKLNKNMLGVGNTQAAISVGVNSYDNWPNFYVSFQYGSIKLKLKQGVAPPTRVDYLNSGVSDSTSVHGYAKAGRGARFRDRTVTQF